MKQLSNTFISAFALNGAGMLDSRFQDIPESRRYALEPRDNGTFILPLQQGFMRNRRIMHSTCRLIALLSGWAGNGAPIKTTQGVLAKKMNMSVRQIQRMLQDAKREGYLNYAYTKTRIGMITGIQIYLRLSRIRKQKPSESRRILDTPKESAINGNISIYKRDEELEAKLQQLSQSMDIDYSFE